MSAGAPQLQHQRHRYLECGVVEVRAGGDVGRIEHRFQYVLDHEAGRGTGGVPVAVEVPGMPDRVAAAVVRSEEHTSELQSLMRISYAVFCLKKKKNTTKNTDTQNTDISTCHHN